MKLECKGISKAYGKKQALSPLNLTFTEGIYGLLGPNGAGKTTLMHLLVGLLASDSGEILADGMEIGKLGAAYRSKLGFLPQEPGFYPGFTGEEILRYFAKLKGIHQPQKKIATLLELVNLTDDRKKKVGQYSGGMKRRLGIAIALLGDPALLILDEPTAGLDPKERMRFRNIIGQIGFGKIVILATHIVSDVECISDHCILLKEGCCIGADTADALKENIRGKVWNTPSDEAEAERYVMEHACANLIKSDTTLMIRSVSDAPPFPHSVAAEPNLEDVYLYYFNQSGRDGESP